MIQDMTSVYADLVKAAFFPSTPALRTVPVKEKQVIWCSPMDGMGAWLPLCVRYVRCVKILMHSGNYCYLFLGNLKIGGTSTKAQLSYYLIDIVQ